MGLAIGVLKTIIAAAFVLISIISFSMGVQRGHLERQDPPQNFALDMLPSDRLRRKLISELQNASSPIDQQLVERFARMKPTSEIPFEIALAVASMRGDEQNSDALAVLALSRQPRSLAARLHFLRASADREDYASLLRHYERLIEIGSLDKTLLTDALIGVFRDNDKWDVLLEHLKANPQGSETIVDRILKEPSIPPNFGSILLIFPSRQGEYLDRLRGEQGLSDAYQVWLSYMTAASEVNTNDYPFNGNFRNSHEKTLFNWTIHYERAEIQKDDGLFVSYTGIGSPLIARQVMAAPPGDYVVNSSASGRMYERGGTLQWELYCNEDRRRLVVFEIALESIAAPELFESNLRIPESGCDFQTLELRGRAGAFPKISRTEISSISMIGSN